MSRMPCVTVLRGDEITDYSDDRGNRIIGTPAVVQPQTQVVFGSDNCTVRFGEDVNWMTHIYFNDEGGTVEVDDGAQCIGQLELGRDCTVRIGKRLNVTGNFSVVTEDGCTVEVGDNCLFADKATIRAYDHHPIFDLDTRERINFARDVSIGSDVWLGYGVQLMGGARVGHGSVVGTMSIVTASNPIGDHCLAVGQPATVKRERIAWAKNGRPPASRMDPGAHTSC